MTGVVGSLPPGLTASEEERRRDHDNTQLSHSSTVKPMKLSMKRYLVQRIGEFPFMILQNS